MLNTLLQIWKKNVNVTAVNTRAENAIAHVNVVN